MSRRTPIRRTPNHVRAARVQLWFAENPEAFPKLVDNGIERMERELAFEAWYQAHRRAEVMRSGRHPAGRLRECTPPAWSPAPDPAHERAHRSLTRDVLALLWKAIRR